MTLHLTCDARGIIKRLSPFVEQALESGLLNEQEVADLLMDEIIEAP